MPLDQKLAWRCCCKKLLFTACINHHWSKIGKYYLTAWFTGMSYFYFDICSVRQHIQLIVWKQMKWQPFTIDADINIFKKTTILMSKWSASTCSWISAAQDNEVESVESCRRQIHCRRGWVVGSGRRTFFERFCHKAQSRHHPWKTKQNWKWQSLWETVVVTTASIPGQEILWLKKQV